MRLARAGVGAAILVMAITPATGAAETPRCLGRAATITGGSGRVIRGTPGDDVITAYGDDYEVHAGRGNDLVCADSAYDVVRGGPGADHLRGRVSAGLYGGQGDDQIEGTGWSKGGSGDDRVTGRAVWGGPGHDALTGVRGGSLFFERSRHGVHVDLQKGRATGEGRDALQGDFDNVFRSRHDDVLIGHSKVNFLSGGRGHDRIVAGAGNDMYLYGGSGNDSISGGAGADQVFGHEGDDRVFGGGGDDLVWPGHGDDFVAAGPGPDQIVPKHGDDEIRGGGGSDAVHYFFWPEPIEIDLAAGWAEGAGSDFVEGVEEAYGGNGDDVLRGDDGPNVLFGYAGNDRIEGFGGDDSIDAGDGIDVVDGGDGNDVCENAETPVSCEDTQPLSERSILYLTRSRS